MSSHADELRAVGALADLLRETAEHHDAFEKSTPPHDWWDWYAPYLDARQRGRTAADATDAADRYMKEVRDIVRGAPPADVPPSAEPVPATNHGFHTILVAVDGSASSDQGIAFAVDLAAEHHAELILVHVVPPFDVFPTGDDEVVAVPHEASGDDRASLDDAAAAAADRGVAATTALLPGGSAADEIVAHGEANDVDLIIVGSCGHGAVKSTLLGSVSLGVLRRSTRPVVVVRGDIAYRPTAATTD